MSDAEIRFLSILSGDEADHVTMNMVLKLLSTCYPGSYEISGTQANKPMKLTADLKTCARKTLSDSNTK